MPVNMNLILSKKDALLLIKKANIRSLDIFRERSLVIIENRFDIIIEKFRQYSCHSGFTIHPYKISNKIYYKIIKGIN